MAQNRESKFFACLCPPCFCPKDVDFRIEWFCCKTNALSILNCKSSPQIGDSKSTFDISLPPNRKPVFIGNDGVETIEVIRNVAVINAFE